MEFIAKHPKLYIVGGCVRDSIMGVEPKDIDYCFAGSEQELKALFPEANMVGVSFPVYMVDGCEVALTRTEESTGDSYGDFEVTNVGVSIEDDLNRRDFTMNQMAINTVTGELVDPTNGSKDIENGIIRTTNKDAFKDDPVRILRALRFATTFDFNIDTDTFDLMKKEVARLKFVTKERIVLELEKMYKGARRPSHFFYLLSKMNGLDVLSPVLTKMHDVPAGPEQFHGKNTVFQHTMEVVDRVKKQNGSFSAFVAALTHDFGKVFTPDHVLPHHYGHENTGIASAKEFINDHRFDAFTNSMVLVGMKNHMKAHFIDKMKPINVVRFVKGVPKHMVDDFLTLVFSDHPPTTEEREKFKTLFSFVNGYKLTEDEVAVVNKAKDKRNAFERILTKRFAEFKQTQ